MKRCFKCQVEKPLSAFYKHSMMSDGHLGKCKECAKKDSLATRLAKIEQYRAYDRMRASQPHRVALRSRIVAEWQKQHPDRRRAQSLLGSAVRCGRVVPWPVCAVPECNDKPEAHHPDYDQPLQVVWLCPAHHKQTHALMRNLDRKAA